MWEQSWMGREPQLVGGKAAQGASVRMGARSRGHMDEHSHGRVSAQAQRVGA